MALTGTLTADFSSFYRATEEAKVRLQGFEASSSRVETQLSKMVNSLSGTKLIAQAQLMAEAVDRIGGVSKLTADELARVGAVAQAAADKFRAFGGEAPAKIRALADAAKPIPEHFTLADRAVNALTGTIGQFVAGFTIANLIDRGASAMFRFASEAVESAGALVDLSGKTGIGVEALQRFQVAGAASGVSVDNFADAAFKLGVKLSGGSGSVKHALDELGVSFESIRNLRAEDQFTIISAALEGVTSEQDRNRLGVELFGKSFSSIAPAIADGYSKIAAAATVAGEAQVKAIDAASDRWTTFVANTKSTVTSVIGDYLLAGDAIGPFKLALLQVTGLAPVLVPALSKMGEETNALAESMKRLSDANAFVGPKLPATVRSFATELSAITTEFAGLTIEQKQNINAGLELGRTMDEISLKTGVSIEAIKLVKEETTESAAAMKEWASSTKQVDSALETLHKSSLKIFKEIAAERDRQKDVVNAAVLAEFEAQQELNRLYRVEAPSALKQYEQALHDLHRAKAEGISQSAQEQILVEKFTRALYDEAVAQDKANIERAEGNRIAADVPPRMAQATEAIYSFAGALTATTEDLRRFNDQFANEIGVFGRLSGAGAVSVGIGAGTRRVPGFAGGVENFGGGLAIVGERGPELVNLPRGSSVIPRAAGTTIVNNVTIRDSFVGSRADAERMIESALTKFYASRGVRFPTGV